MEMRLKEMTAALILFAAGCVAVSAGTMDVVKYRSSDDRASDLCLTAQSLAE